MKNAKLFFVVGLVSDDSMWAYTLSKFRLLNFKWKVQFWLNIVTLKCSCMMFESIGIPCCHMVVVMKMEHLEEIPLFIAKVYPSDYYSKSTLFIA